MMNALDVLSVADAKQYLAIDYPDYDTLIQSAIYATVDLVEKITNYRLFQRDEVIVVGIQKYDAFQFPINNIVSVKDQDNADSVYTLRKAPLRWTFDFNSCQQYFYAGQYPEIAPAGNKTNTITLDVGYSDTTEVPQAIVFAIKLLITEIIENRLPTKEQMPNDVVLMLQPYMRYTLF